MARRRDVERLDPALMERVAGMSSGGQRWLKTAISTIKSMPLEVEERDRPTKLEAPRRRAPRPSPEPPAPRMPGLEDVLTGKADLKDLDGYGELSEELEGLGDIIDMLRSLGQERRKRGEQILRDELLDDDERPAEDDEDFSF